MRPRRLMTWHRCSRFAPAHPPLECGLPRRGARAQRRRRVPGPRPSPALPHRRGSPLDQHMPLPSSLLERWGAAEEQSNPPPPPPLPPPLPGEDADEAADIERVASCAVSLEFLCAFYDAAVKPLQAPDGPPLTTRQVRACVICSVLAAKPRAYGLRRSFARARALRWLRRLSSLRQAARARWRRPCRARWVSQRRS